MNNLNLGIALMNSKSYENAVNFFTKCIQNEPDNTEAYYLRAKANAALNRQNQAVNDLHKAIELQDDVETLIVKESKEFENLHINPFFFRIAFPRDKINKFVEMMYDGEFEKASVEFENYIKTDKFIAVAYFYLSICYYQTNNFEKSLKAVDSYIKVNPELADAYFNKGCIFEAEEKFEQAIEQYNIAIEKDTTNPNFYFNIANIYTQINNLQDALDNFTKSLDLNPDFTLSLFKRAFVFSKLKQIDNAKNDLKKLVKLDPKAKKSILENEFLKELI